MFALITAALSVVVLGYKIYSDSKTKEKTDAKIGVIVNHMPDIQDEIEEMESAWKEYKKSRSK